MKSQYPHSRAASCRNADGQSGSRENPVSIPSQSGSLLSVWPRHWHHADGTVSIPSQSGSLLSEQAFALADAMGTSQYPHSRAASCRGLGSFRSTSWTISLNTLTVGHPLVGAPLSVSMCFTQSQYPHSRAASCRAATSAGFVLGPGVSQYPHSRAASCRRLAAVVFLALAGSQYPHSRAASCRRLMSTLTGRPLSVSIPSQSGSLLSEGRHRAVPEQAHGLNTLTVGQPLVGASFTGLAYGEYVSQYPHSRAASCRQDQRPIKRGPLRSQYPHSRAASCRFTGTMIKRDEVMVSIPSQSGSLLSVHPPRLVSRREGGLNTLTVGHPLVGRRPHLTLARRSSSQYPHSRAASCRQDEQR